MTHTFLISTTHHLLVLDQTERFYRVDSGRGLYYGSAIRGDYIYVACQNQPESVSDERLIAEQAGSILVFDAAELQFQEELRPQFQLRGVHGIASFDNRLWVTCSFDNLIAIYDFGTRNWTKWYPAIDVLARDRDVNHFNTIVPVETQICIVAHNRGSSDLLFFDRASRDLCSVTRLGNQSHDLFWVDGQPAICSSGDGELVSTGNWLLRTGGFPRGIASAGSTILVGISVPAARLDRPSLSGVVRRFGIDWRHCSDYLLQETGMVLGILPLNRPDNSELNLAIWEAAITFRQRYNDVMPGNVYSPGLAVSTCHYSSEWHASETTFRWTASRIARLTIVVNPGETMVTVKAINCFPGTFRAEVQLNGLDIGSLSWEGPSEVIATFELPAKTQGRCVVGFAVPHLWRPADTIGNSNDGRLLGVAISSVAVS
jgi:hypothetical protein